MKKLVTLFMLMPVLAHAQAFVDWVEYTRGLSVAADQWDNVFTVDYAYEPGGDIFLTKRDASGTFLWEATYNNTDPTKFESATWVETDSEGNAIVAGTVNSGYSNPVKANSIIMKFSPDGDLLWRDVYETDFDGSYTKKCIVDQDGNIYVLGAGSGLTGFATKVKKYSPAGDSLWSYVDNSGIGLPVNIKFTPDNSILLVGRAQFGSINGYAKITKDGQPVWSMAGVNSLTVGDASGDADGNTYIVHGEYVTNGGTVIKKLSPSGDLIWENVYNLTAFRIETGSDNMPVACGFPSANSFGSAFIKVNGEGTVEWENLDADGALNLMLHAQLRMDASDNIYLAAGTMFEMAICKVNSNGSSAWTLTMPGSYANGFDIGSDNSVLVAGGTTAKIVQENEVGIKQASPANDDFTSVYPNPFQSLVNISFTLDKPAETEGWIINQQGQEVGKIVDATLPAGTHNYQWSPAFSGGTGLAGGVYFVKIRNGNQSRTTPILHQP